MTHQLFDPEVFSASLADVEDPLPLFRETISQGNQKLADLFHAGEPVTSLVKARAQMIDALLVAAWNLKIPGNVNTALVAVGGYGRGELHPNSDIDLMILMEDENQDHLSESLGELLTFFWDIGLEIGHSVRTLEESIREAEQDITIATNIMESRLLTGPADLFDRMREATGSDRIWPSDRFFRATDQYR